MAQEEEEEEQAKQGAPQQTEAEPEPLAQQDAGDAYE